MSSFAEEEEACDLVEEAAVAMLPLSGYGNANLLRGPSLYLEWHPHEVNSLYPPSLLPPLPSRVFSFFRSLVELLINAFMQFLALKR